MSPRKKQCNAVRHRITKSRRDSVYTKDGYACVFCASRGPLSLDHVVAVKELIGTVPVMLINHEVNLVTACFKCNGERVSGSSRRLRYGRFMGHEEHFASYHKRTIIALKALQESVPLQQEAARAAWLESNKMVSA